MTLTAEKLTDTLATLKEAAGYGATVGSGEYQAADTIMATINDFAEYGGADEDFVHGMIFGYFMHSMPAADRYEAYEAALVMSRVDPSLS